MQVVEPVPSQAWGMGRWEAAVDVFYVTLPHRVEDS